MNFGDWIDRWMALGRYTGTHVPEPKSRIKQALALWREPIDPGWARGLDDRLLDPARRDCRREASVRRVRERAIEDDVLLPDPREHPTCSFCMHLVDGVNAVPLTTNPGAGKRKNVEADMLLLVRGTQDQHALHLIEVKDGAQNAWYAAFENLCQLRFLLEAPNTPLLFHRRQSDLNLPRPLPATGVVLAGSSAFYEARGQKSESLAPTRTFVGCMRVEAGVNVELAIWDSVRRCIEPF